MTTPHEKTSKFLSFVLRHQPQSIGLELDAQGWAEMQALIDAANQHGRRLTPELIRDVAANCEKQRFCISDDGQRIRANQGHSVKIDLALPASQPPDVLYHGTATRFMASIEKSGLIPNGRHHVHLSADVGTARNVGSRHGVPVILKIDARRMTEDGIRFMQSQNGVWLCDAVLPTYFSRME
jgi:putative RNA 2'-phosphotransferase